MKNLLGSKAPFFQMGYRPFFFLGSLYAALSIGFWSMWYARGEIPSSFMPPLLWHSHEMIYGFAIAIIGGFLLTASATWTQTRGLHGPALLGLVFIWGLSRLLIFLSQHFEHGTLFALTSIVDLLFLPLLITALAGPLLKAKMWRNISFLFILGVFWLGNIFYHLEVYELFSFRPKIGMEVGLHTISLILTIIGGRVIPFFTQNALPHIQVSKYLGLERIVIFGTLLVFIFEIIQVPSSVLSLVAFAVGGLHLLRLYFWKPWRTFTNPLLWVLHLGYLWLGLFYILLGSSLFFGVPAKSVSYHALTIGAMGVLIIGMMSRVSLGHSGRPLLLAKGMLFSYGAILLASIVRILIGFYPAIYVQGIKWVAIFWITSFVIFLFYYSKIFFTWRADGKPG